MGMAPVHCLSEDLLRIVLQMVIDAQPRKVSSWIHLTEVCRDWYDMMFDNGALWAQISSPSQEFEVIRRLLILSLDAPLDIELDHDHYSRASPSRLELFESIALHMERVRFLHVALSSGEMQLLGSLFSLGRALPHLLEKLSIQAPSPHYTNESEPQMWPLSYIALPLPRLRSLDISAAMRWNHPALTATITQLRVHDNSSKPHWSLSDVLAAFRRMPFLENVDYVQRAGFRPPRAASEHIELRHIRNLSFVLPFDDLVALCSHLIASNPDRCSQIQLTVSSMREAAEDDIHALLHRAARSFQPYIQAIVPTLSLCITVRYGPPLPVRITIERHYGVAVGCQISIEVQNANATEMGEFSWLHGIWDDLPIRSFVLMPKFDYLIVSCIPAHLWIGFAALRCVTDVRIVTSFLLLPFLAALEQYPELFPALARLEFDHSGRGSQSQEDLERLRDIFGSVRPQLSDLVLDAATFAAADDGRMLAHCARKIAVIAGDEDEETKLAKYLPIRGLTPKTRGPRPCPRVKANV